MANNKNNAFHKQHRTKWPQLLWGRILYGTSSRSRKLLETLLSDYEKNLIARRVAALILIQEGKGTTEINRVLWLSRATISVLKKNLLGGVRAYGSQRSFRTARGGSKRKIKLPNHSWFEDVFAGVDLWELLKNPPRPSSLGITRQDV